VTNFLSRFPIPFQHAFFLELEDLLLGVSHVRQQAAQLAWYEEMLKET